MRLTVLLALPLVACAHEEDMKMAASPPPFEETQGQAPMTYHEAPSERSAPPRLSHTVTLGQQEDYAPLPPPGQPQGQGGNVVVNNNINVTPSGYGYGYGYGGGYYGGYTRSYGYRGVNASPDGRGGMSAPPRSAWAPSGWEGAQRTAAPGQTPGVGGNYSPPPSYGPQQMK
jgi:hypothetical protein